MTVMLNGRELTRADVVAVAREGARVAVADDALAAMAAARALADDTQERGLPTYGLTTGLGAQKRTTQAREDAGFDRRQIAESRAGLGRPAPRDVVRAAMLVLANQLAAAFSCARPELAERLVAALNDDLRPVVRSLGSLGAADLAAMADIAHAVYSGFDLAPGEGLALISPSAFGTGSAALALTDAARLLDAADVAGALSLEGFAANLSVLHPVTERARRDPVLARTLARFRDLLDGSCLWGEGAARNLQDPLTYRSTAPIQSAARRALEHADDVLAIELNAQQGNPLVSVADRRIVSAAVYEVVGLAAALDYVRTAFATTLTAACERTVKLLDTPWSGLPTGLLPGGGPDLGLSILAVTAQSLAAEASLLAQPVSFAVASSAGAEGIEDRATHLPLAARRLAEMTALGEGVVAIELVVSAQAVDTRGMPPMGRGTRPPGVAAPALGRGTREAYESVREAVPELRAGDTPPVDVEPVRALVQAGAIGRAARDLRAQGA
jgi:histidine ammonia-lyase